MKSTIKTISDSFIKEALASPRMLEDLASMEKYMSESYDGRTFVELIQNADDARSREVKVFSVGNTLVVANSGRPFNEDDIMAICRSGSSNKLRGNSIGYRGVGFKSATTISNEIVIYSAGTYFTFSKQLCAKTLGKSPLSVPTVRIPFLYDKADLSSGVISAIRQAENEGFTTFFIFLNANTQKFISELDGFSDGWLLFLKHIQKIDVDLPGVKKICSVSRRNLSNGDTLVSTTLGKDRWYIVSNESVSLAFKYDDGGIKPCAGADGCFHCFLPTLDKTGYPFKINADFSTDPSRKHLIMDDLTQNALESVERLFVSFFIRAILSSDKKLMPVVSLVTSPISLSELTTEIEKGIFNRLRTAEWVELHNGLYTTPENTYVLPDWLSTEEQNVITTISSSVANSTPSQKLLCKIEKIDKLLIKVGAKEVPLNTLADVLKETNSVNKLDASLAGKLFVHCCRGCLSNQGALEQIFIPLTNGSFDLLKNVSDPTLVNAEFLKAINILSIKEKNTLVESFPVFTCLLNANANQSRSGRKITLTKSSDLGKKVDLAISKWKTPIQNCITIETLNGNTAKDMGKKCAEYSVTSTDAFGNTTYIAVKSVGVLGDSFTLTESEYDAAVLYGGNYKVYLFTTDTNSVMYSVITDPVNSKQMKKVVKEWEWVCSDYSDDNLTESESGSSEKLPPISNDDSVDFDKMDGEAFEQFCARLLIKNGYEDVSLTKGSGDQGIDIIAYRDGIKCGIQCKCYSSDIGNGAVQEVFAGKTFYKCNVGIVLTNQHFSASAIQLAEANGVVLWARETLIKLIKKTIDNVKP